MQVAYFCKIKIESIFQTTIRLMNKNSHLSPFSSSSVAEAINIEEKEKTFEMILRQSKFKECTVLLSILKQNHLIHPSKHSHFCLLLLLLLFFMEYRFFLCEDIILKYLVSLQKTLLWTAQLWTEPFCNPLEP